MAPYVPRAAPDTVLHGVLRDRLETGIIAVWVRAVLGWYRRRARRLDRRSRAADRRRWFLEVAKMERRPTKREGHVRHGD